MVQYQLLQLVDQEPAHGLDHALGLAGGAGGEHDHGGVVELPLLVHEGLWYGLGEEILVEHSVGHGGDILRLARVVDHHYLLEPLHAGRHLGGVGQGIEFLALVVVPVRGKQDFGGYLTQPVEGGAGADIRGAGAPDPAHGRGGQHGDDGLREVRKIGGHRVPGPHAQLPEGRSQAEGLLLHVLPGEHPADLVLAPEDQARFVVGFMAQQVLRIVQPAAGEPLGSGESVDVVHGPLVAHGMDDVQIPEQYIPKGLRLVHGEAIELPVAPIVPALLPVHQLHEGIHVGSLLHLFTGGPQQLAHRSLLHTMICYLIFSKNLLMPVRSTFMAPMGQNSWQQKQRMHFV